MSFSLDSFSLKNKVAVVTGGNTGIGLAYVEAFASLGANVLVTHFTDELDKTKKIEKKYGVKIEYWKGDLTKESSSKEVLKFALEKFNHVDILVNNAGTIQREPVLEHTKEKWDKVININLNAVWHLSQTFAIHFSKQKSGKIINIASMLSFQGGLFVPGYAASKHGVVGLTKALSNELAEKGVQVNAIAPGYIISENTAPIRADKKRNNSIIERIPMGKWGNPSDLMGAVSFLASSASDYVTGIVLCVDGGWQAR